MRRGCRRYGRERENDRAVVFPDATIADSAVRNSVIDEGVTLEDVDLSGALIGSYTSITDGDGF